MITKNDFAELPYEKVPLNKILNEYNKQIDEAVIFARFENLERHYDALLLKRRRKEYDYKKLNLEYKKTEASIKFLQKKNKEIEKDKPNKRKELKKTLNKKIEALLQNVTKAEQEKEEALGNIRDFEKDYLKEIEFIYSNKKVRKNFAWGRLYKPGKFRIMEHLLIAQHTDINLETFYNSEYLDSTDRLMLVGKEFVPLEVLKKRFKELPIRIKNLERLIKNAEELGKKYGEYRIEKSKIHDRIDDLIYERCSFRDYLNKQIKEGNIKLS